MRSRLATLFLFAASLPLTSIASPLAAHAQSAAANAALGVTVGPSGLPLPRFVSLKSGRVNLRIGPGLNYAIDWMYLKSGLPMEIIQEFDNWRRVRDADGTEGWINQSLLSGKRTAIIAPWQRGEDVRLNLRSEADDNARIVAEIEPGAVGAIGICNGEWCQVSFGKARGWLGQSTIWGVYPRETIAD